MRKVLVMFHVGQVVFGLNMGIAVYNCMTGHKWWALFNFVSACFAFRALQLNLETASLEGELKALSFARKLVHDSYRPQL